MTRSSYLKTRRDNAVANGVGTRGIYAECAQGSELWDFAFEHAGVAADLVTMAKGMAAGFPLSAVTGRAEVVEAPPVGGIGGNYPGNPLAVAAANAMLNIIQDEGMCANAAKIGAIIKARLTAVSKRQGMEAIGDVRGLGAMIAFELVKNRETREPDAALTAAIVAQAEQRGLIILTCGTRANGIRLLPPLNTSDALVDEALDVLEVSIEAAITNYKVKEYYHGL